MKLFLRVQNIQTSENEFSFLVTRHSESQFLMWTQNSTDNIHFQAAFLFI